MKEGFFLKKIIALFTLSLILLLFAPDSSKAATVYWDGIELKQGQIGRVSILKPINLWKKTENGLAFERVLKAGEIYRVYRIDSSYGGQYGVGGSHYITAIDGYVKYETPSAEKKKLLNCDQVCLVDGILQLPLEDYDAEAVKQMKERLSKLPEKLLVQLNTNKIKIQLVNGPITETSLYSYLKGKVPRGWEGTGKTWDDVPGIGGGKTVVVRIGYSEKGKGHGAVNLELHELAHSIDSILKNNISSSKKFREIWEKERTSLFPYDHYMIQFQEEYFAEAFAMYYLNKELNRELLKMAPLTYQFIKTL